MPGKIPKQKYLLFIVTLIVSILTAGLFYLNAKTHGHRDHLSIFPPPYIKNFHIVPEYKKTLKKIFISISATDNTLEKQDFLLSHLPGYSKILLFLPEKKLATINEWAKNKPYKKKIQFIPYDEHKNSQSNILLLFRDKPEMVSYEVKNYFCFTHPVTIWAQDLFESLQDKDGETLLIISCVHKYFSSPDSNATLPTPDNDCLFACESTGLEILRAPLAFKGGNILFDEINNQKIGFIGGDVLRTTMTIQKAFGMKDENLINKQTIKTLKTAFNLDKLVILRKNQLQPKLMYHLDQAFVLLGNKQIGIANIIIHSHEESLYQSYKQEIDDARDFINEIRLSFSKEGYQIHDIHMSARNLVNYQHYTNLIPFTDEETQRRKIFMPVFPDSYEEDQSLIQKNVETFASLGFDVMLVPTSLNKDKGGIHCLVNVID